MGFPVKLSLKMGRQIPAQTPKSDLALVSPPLCFGHVWELSKTSPNLDPWTPYPLPKYFQKYKKHPNSFSKSIILTYFKFLDIQNFVLFWKG